MKNLIIIFLIAFTTSIVNSQEYKEWLIYDLNGSVQEVKVSTQNPYIRKHVKFQKNGKCKKSVTFFNDKGYPQGWSAYSGSKGVEQTISYDTNNRISSIVTNSSIPLSGEYSNTATYIYEEQAPILTQIKKIVYLVNKDTKTNEVTCEYSGYIYDDYGNWIHREVTQTINPLDSTEIKKTSTYSEDRTIKYFNSNKK